MSINLAKLLPSRSTALAIFVAFSLGLLLCVPAKQLLAPTTPRGPADASFAALGRAHAPRLIAAEASGYEAGIAALDAGKPFSEALATIPATRHQLRVESFARFIQPDFARTIPDGKADAEITPAEREAVKIAWRSFAAGLRGKSP